MSVATSVRQRLLNRARARGEEFEQLLVRFALERLLYRLHRSEHVDQFVLKGALLFTLWVDLPQRPTRDADFLAFGDPDPRRLAAVFVDLATRPVDIDDGVSFDATTVRAEAIRKLAGYPGVRVSLQARLAGARIAVQCDIGFGDAVVPAAERRSLPTLLDFPAPQLRVYPPESVVAEKLEALVKLADFNSRLKDYFDLWVLFEHELPDRSLLPTAIATTFARRGTTLPAHLPEGLGIAFAHRNAAQWHAFLSRHGLQAPGLPEVVGALTRHCMPLLQAAQERPACKR